MDRELALVLNLGIKDLSTLKKRRRELRKFSPAQTFALCEYVWVNRSFIYQDCEVPWYEVYVHYDLDLLLSHRQEWEAVTFKMFKQLRTMSWQERAMVSEIVINTFIDAKGLVKQQPEGRLVPSYKALE